MSHPVRSSPFARLTSSWWIGALSGLALAVTLAGLAGGETTILVAGLALLVAAAGLWLLASAGLLLVKSAGRWLLACVGRGPQQDDIRRNKRAAP